jgi:hypothetical protein
MIGLTNRGRLLVLTAFFRNSQTLRVVLLAKKNEHALNAAAATNEGAGKVGLPCTTHGYAAGAAIVVSGTVNYNGRWLVDSATTTNKIVILALYRSETFTGAELVHEAPGPLTNTMAAVVEIAAGNGYDAGGITLTADGTDFPTVSQDDSGNRAFARMRDVSWTASGGAIPASGDGARYAALIDDNATPANRQLVGYGSLDVDRSVAEGGIIPLLNFDFVLAEV